MNRSMHACMALLLVCAGGTAWGQTTVYVSPDIANSAVFPATSTPVYTSIQEGVDAAVTASRNASQTVRVAIEAGEWTLTDPIEVPADANIQIVGAVAEDSARDAAGRPWEVIIDGGGYFVASAEDINGVFYIHTDTSGFPSKYQGDGASNLLLEGLTIRNAKYGVQIRGTSGADGAAIQPTLSRCIILGGSTQTAGVQVERNAAPLLVNCSITGYSVAATTDATAKDYESGIGVHVTAPPNTTAKIYTDILFCSIMMNSDYGVLVDTGANARVRNTLVYRNGDGQNGTYGAEGGLVWRNSAAFIDPSYGPYDATTPAKINGYDLLGGGSASDVKVYFGPLDKAEAVTPAAGSTETQLNVTVPASYLGAPGPVDVYIQRGDGLRIAVKEAFNYTASTTELPQVTSVAPAKGPVITANTVDPLEKRGNWVYVYGTGFEKNCQVWFDVDNPSGRTLDITKDLRSEKVTWMSSSELYVKVPAQPTAVGPVDVFVRNTSTATPQVSPAGTLREYEFVATLTLPRPSIVQVTPNIVRELDASTGTGNESQTVDIVGWNFGPGKRELPAGSGVWYPQPVIVRIGGVVCEYDGLIADTSQTVSDPDNGIFQGVDDANGDSFDTIQNVVVPEAFYGSGGSYDVEVVNFDGQSDTLPNGLTYYGDGVPAIDDSSKFPWRPANFAAFATTGTGSAATRVLYGSGFDTGLGITFTQGAATRTLNGATAGVVLPGEAVAPHVKHTQRAITFSMPSSPSEIATAFGDAAGALNVAIANVRNVAGDDTSVAEKTASTTFNWVAAANDFSITQVAANASGTPAWRMIGKNLAADMLVYVQEEAAINVELDGADLVFDLPESGLDGVYGAVDVAAKSGDNYYVLEGGLFLPRTDATGAAIAPTISSIEPRVLPQSGGVEVTVHGSDFIGPADGAHSATQVSFVSGTTTRADSISVAGTYQVVSDSEITFTLAASPLSGVYDVQVQHVAVAGSTAVSTTADTLSDAVTFASSVSSITAVFRWDLAPAQTGPPNYGYADSATAAAQGQRWGAVQGGDVLVIHGAGFTAATKVCIGDAEARVLASETVTDRLGHSFTAPAASATALYVLTPSAPQGLPGTFPVSVVNADAASIAPESQWFTYIMDGQPEITSIEPNYLERDASNNASDTNEGVYFTIRGYNFNNMVDVLFDVEGGTDDATAELACFAVSPYEIVVKAPASDATLGLSDTDYTDGDGLVQVNISVRNDVGGSAAAKQTSAEAPIYYYDSDTITPPSTKLPVLEFNDVYRNFRDYINASPGVGCISVDPMLDPGPETVNAAGPKAAVQAEEKDWWPGKLSVRDTDNGVADNPLRDKAGDYNAGQYGYEDLELDGRPNYVSLTGESIQGTGDVGSAKSDIGADEITLGGLTELNWYYCNVTPNPVGGEALQAGGLDVEIRIQGLTGPLDDTRGIFIVPQGGKPGLHKIPITITSHNGNSVYYGTNTKAIPTVLDRMSTSGAWGSDTGAPRQGDIIADGHAAVYINVLGLHNSGTFTGSTLGLTLRDNGHITSEAVTGRHFLIDTIPPRIYIESYSKGTDYYLTPWDLIPSGTLNDTYTTQMMDTAIGVANHGFTLPAVTWPAGNWWNAAAYLGVTNVNYAAPVEWQGIIVNPFRVAGTLTARTQKPQIFLNTGSLANGLYSGDDGPDLEFTLRAWFIDPVVTVAPTDTPAPYFDSTNYVIAGSARTGSDDDPSYPRNESNFAENLNTREVSGFTSGVVTRTGDNDLLVNEYTSARWFFTQGADTLASGATKPNVTATFTGQAGSTEIVPPVSSTITLDLDTGDIAANAGFNRSNPSSVTRYNNNVMLAEWKLSNLDWKIAHSGPFTLEFKLGGRDRAGNIASTESLLEPLRIYWGIDVQTRFLTTPTSSDNISYTWELVRGSTADPVTMAEPSTVAGPKPLFLPRLYVNTDMQNQSIDGRYQYLSGTGFNWTTATSIDRSGFYQALKNAGMDPDNNEFYVLFVVLGADEAGNVEPWRRKVPEWIDPFDGLGTAGDALFDAPGQAVDFSASPAGDTDLGKRRRAWIDPITGKLPAWHRFRWSSSAMPDTQVSAVYWYGDTDKTEGLGQSAGDQRLGDNAVIVMPPEGTGLTAAAQFTVNAIYANRSNLKILYKLVSQDDSTSDIQTIDASRGAVVLDFENLGDPNRRKPIRYTFSAAAETGAGVIDPTWTNVSFMVTPHKNDPKLEGGKQATKEVDE